MASGVYFKNNLVFFSVLGWVHTGAARKSREAPARLIDAHVNQCRGSHWLLVPRSDRFGVCSIFFRELRQLKIWEDPAAFQDKGFQNKT